MVTSYEQLDRRFEELRPLTNAATRPARGWLRAVREALGMTTAQLAKRIGVHQPRVIELEKAEVSGKVTVQSLERAAEALGCQLVYVLVPLKPLAQTLRQRAAEVADKQMTAVEQTMRLEAQEVPATRQRQETRETLIRELLRKPARLWDEP